VTNGSANSLAAWKSQTGLDAYSITTSPQTASFADLTSEGVPFAGYIDLVAGANLTSIATGSLAGLTTSTTAGSTTTGEARPNSAWDIGAYEISNGAPQVATPTFSPTAGSYGPTQSVTISTSTGGATICHTTDGSTPTANGAGTCTHGTTYSSAVSVVVSETLNAVGSLSGDTDSAVGSAIYTINGAVSTPTFSPVAGTYSSAQSVTISTSTGGATLCYTTDGSTPTANGAGTCTHGTTYSSAVSVSASETLKAIGSESGWSDSLVGSAAHTIGTVTLTPSSQNFGPMAVGFSGAPVTFTLTNTSGVTITGITISNIGGSPSDFPQQSTTRGSSLASGASCNIVVTFSPAAPGSLGTTLDIADSASSSPQRSTLTGTGTPVVTAPSAFPI
jgi:hypothetical protein